MKEKKEKTNKFKINKGQLAVKIMAGILALILSVCATFIYYMYLYIA